MAFRSAMLFSTKEIDMKKLLAIAAIVSLTACGAADRMGASITGFAKSCVDGVTYLQFASGAAVQVDQNGKPVACR